MYTAPCRPSHAHEHTQDAYDEPPPQEYNTPWQPQDNRTHSAFDDTQSTCESSFSMALSYQDRSLYTLYDGGHWQTYTDQMHWMNAYQLLQPVTRQIQQSLMQLQQHYPQVYAVEQMAEEHRKKGLWKRNPHATAIDTTLPAEVHELIHTNILTIVQQMLHTSHDGRFDAQMLLQQSLVIGSTTQKNAIVSELTKQAHGILHNKLGAFVASQILWEATHNDSAMVDEALEFMEEALNANGENNVYLSMKHSHANHAVRAWIELLGTMDETISADRHAHIERFLQEMETIVKSDCTSILVLAQNGLSYRCLMETMKTFGESTRLQGVKAQLCHNQEVLRDLIIHEYANFVVSAMVLNNVEVETIVECIKKHFTQITCNQYGNHVMQNCLLARHCDAHKSALAKLFERHDDEINTYWSTKDIKIYRHLKSAFRDAETFARARRQPVRPFQ